MLISLFFILSPLFVSANCTLSIEVGGAIGPATYDYIQQAEQKAAEKNCQSILMKINTPGGNLQSTRKIVEKIMGSPRPYLCVVYPAGGHAGSAGAIIMQACHINGAHEATNLGAATPISGSGQEIPDDLKNKIFEDTKSWVEGLAKYRGRSVSFARDIVTKAKALDAKAAHKVNAIDVVINDIEEFLDFANGKEVRLQSEKKVPVQVGEIAAFEPSLRHDVLQILSNPQWAYLIFMGSIGLLYFEMTHPGAIVPGVVGAMGLVISLINFHMLDVWWGGVGLILLGVAFLFAELFVPSFGALGLGGLVSFIVGSLFLFDESKGYQVPITLILSTSIFIFLMMMGLTVMAVQAMRRGRDNRQKEKYEGKKLIIKSFDLEQGKGIGLFQGELWKVESEQNLTEDDEAVIQKVEGLTLYVKK